MKYVYDVVSQHIEVTFEHYLHDQRKRIKFRQNIHHAGKYSSKAAIYDHGT